MAPATGSASPPAVTCRSGWFSVLRFGLCIVLVSLLLSLLALPWLHLSWWKVFRRCVSIGAALSLWFCATKFEHRRVSSYGLSGWAGAGKRELITGLLLGFGALGFLLGLGLASGSCILELAPDGWKLWRTVLGFLPAAPLVGLLEELTFRGFLLQHLMSCSRPVAVIATSALYAMVHLKTLPWTAATSRELIGLYLLGVVLAVTTVRTGTLYMAIGLHAALAYGARVNKVVMSFTGSSSAWLVGTSRLVNGVASWVALLAIGAVVVWWTQPQRRGGSA